MSWDESFSVKVSEIDEQHKKLINMINELFDAMSSGKGKDILANILQDMVGYTAEHFGTEEKYFEQFGYPDKESHKLEHQKFVAKVTDFQSKFTSGEIGLSVDIMNFLKDWLINHIKGTDQKYSDFFNEKGLN